MNIEQAKDIYESLKRNEHIVANIDKEFFFRFAETVLNELEKKDAVIDEMAKWVHNNGTDETEICDYEKCTKYITKKKPFGDCYECIKEYFYKKVGNKNEIK